ncbi:MAG: 6,7-dimethyl-8-ribityllumazine synthase [Ignavibacteria bacterium]|nr:6,7-dimethyl-8-ribityllumazine synthase [Ignavibacteria bacterium]
MKTLEGNFVATDKKIAIVVARWNYFVVEKLLDGAVDCYTRHGGDDANITVVYCPGCYEIPLVTKRLAQSDKYHGIITLGAVIRGATPHFDYVASEVSKGVAQVSMETGVPCIFGVLTTDSIEQAVERSGTKSGNKGFDAMMAALEMTSLFEKIGQ